MGLMAFGANETPIQHIGLVELLLIFLCEEAFSLSCLSVSFFLCLSLSLPLSLYRSVSLCLSLSVSFSPFSFLDLHRGGLPWLSGEGGKVSQSSGFCNEY